MVRDTESGRQLRTRKLEPPRMVMGGAVVGFVVETPSQQSCAGVPKDTLRCEQVTPYKGGYIDDIVQAAFKAALS